MDFEFNKCPHCNQAKTLMSNRNNLMAQPLCFECLASMININDMHDAEKFCRTYNIAFNPAVWTRLLGNIKDPIKFLQYYASTMLDCKNNSINKETGEYEDKTDLTFEKLNELWAKTTHQIDIMNNIQPIKDAFVERGQLDWGKQYSYEDLIKLDDLYIKSLKANSITNPIQKESLRTLIKVMIDMNKSITTKDSTELKNLTNAFATLAKTAQLDNLIEDTHTEEITTLAEVAQVVEDAGFDMPYYDGADRDAIDVAIHDIQESNARLVKEATGLGPMIEDMVKKYKEDKEIEKTKREEKKVSIDDILEAYDKDTEVVDEDDSNITNKKFNEVD
jgi:hypothetical protein